MKINNPTSIRNLLLDIITSSLPEEWLTERIDGAVVIPRRYIDEGGKTRRRAIYISTEGDLFLFHEVQDGDKKEVHWNLDDLIKGLRKRM